MPETLTLETRGHVLLIGLNRPEKKNAFNLKMLRDLSTAIGCYEADPSLRAAVLFAHGPDFTAGLDLADMAGVVARGEPIILDGAFDPLGVHGRARTKPLVVAVHGLCLTIGVELMLAADIAVVAEDARLAQIEVKRGIFPFGGASQRWVAATGWGNAMRYLLTGDEVDGATAVRIGLAQDVLPADEVLPKTVAIAETIAAQAPLGVAATLRSARLGIDAGDAAAFAELMPELRRLMDTEDAQEGVMSFLQRRTASFKGRRALRGSYRCERPRRVREGSGVAACTGWRGNHRGHEVSIRVTAARGSRGLLQLFFPSTPMKFAPSEGLGVNSAAGEAITADIAAIIANHR